MRWIKHVLVVVVAALAVLMPAREAYAQRGMSRMMGMSNGGSIQRRSMEDYAKLLGLSAEQKDALTSLHEAYREESKELNSDLESQFQTLMDKARDSGDWMAMQKEMPGMMVEFTTKAKGIEKKFLDDARALLMPEQEEKWSSVEKHRRREKNMRVGLFSGAGLDVIATVSRTRADPGSKEFTEILSQYESAMDAKLVEYERMGEEMQKDMFEGGGMNNMARQMEMLKEAGVKAKELRDINRDYIKRLTPLMSEDGAGRFTAEVNKRSYPRIYRDAHIAKQIAAGIELADVSPEQQRSLRELKEQYTREAATVNETLARETDKAEEEAGGSIALMMNRFMREGNKEEGLKEARAKRSELDEKTEARLKEILSKDQMKQLPKRKPREMNPFDPFGMAGDEEEDEE